MEHVPATNKNALENRILAERAAVLSFLDDFTRPVDDSAGEEIAATLRGITAAVIAAGKGKKAIASLITTLLHDMSGIDVANAIVPILANHCAILRDATPDALEKRSITNWLDDCFRRIVGAGCGVKIKCDRSTGIYAITAAPVPAPKVVTAAATGTDAAQNGVKVDQLGAGMVAGGEDAGRNPLSAIPSDVLIAELASRCADRATFELMFAAYAGEFAAVAIVDAPVVKKGKAKKAA